MTKRKAKIGDRVKFQSLDDSIPPEFGTITELSPSGNRAEIKWEDGDVNTHDLTNPASCVTVLR